MTSSLDPHFVLDALPQGILLVEELDHRVTYANASANRISRRDMQAEVGKPFSSIWPGMLERQTKEGPSYGAVLRSVFGGQRSTYSFDVEWEDDIQGHGWYHCTWIRAGEGHVVILYTDITSDPLRRAKAHLASYARLVNHEIRAPLGRVSLATDVISTEIEQEGSFDLERVKTYCGIAARGSRRLLSVTETLAAATRVEGGDVLMRSNSLREIAEKAIEATSHIRKEDIVEVFGDGTSYCDAGLVQISVKNLVSNAIKYGDNDRPRNVEIRLRDNEVEVHDDGWGVPEENRPDLFREFSRFHSGTEGSGLGLSLCRNIAEMHNGSLTYRPREPRGSIFTLSLKSQENP